MTFRHIPHHFVSGGFQKIAWAVHACITRVTSLEELGTMFKNIIYVRGITLGISSI